MRHPARGTTLAIAAIVVVILPLLVTISTLAANFALDTTGSEISVFGRLGSTYPIFFGWTLVAVSIVGGLVATILTPETHA